jgi:hypothetical protein
LWSHFCGVQTHGVEQRGHVAGVEAELVEILRTPPQRLGIARRILERLGE